MMPLLGSGCALRSYHFDMEAINNARLALAQQTEGAPDEASFEAFESEGFEESDGITADSPFEAFESESVDEPSDPFGGLADE